MGGAWPFLLLLFLPALWAGEFDHAVWDRVLKRHVNELGEVDYAAIGKDRREMDAYIASLGKASPDNRKDLFPGRGSELAYWLNAYNAFVTRGVVDGWPVKSVRDLGLLWGFFRKKEHVAGGVTLSLNQVEHDIIRKRYNEPRIHFAVVCASISCPRLARDAFRPDRLEEQLESAARRFFRERRNFEIDAAAGTVRLSKLLDWYGGDFRPDVLSFARKYLDAADAAKLGAIKRPRVRFFDYDWSVNEPGSRARAASPRERALAASGR